MATKVEKLRLKQEQLAAQLKAELSKQKKRDRKVETRRKVLLGALTQHLMGTNAAFKAVIDQHLPAFLTRNVDRAVFDLASSDPSPESPQKGPPKADTAATLVSAVHGCWGRR